MKKIRFKKKPPCGLNREDKKVLRLLAKAKEAFELAGLGGSPFQMHQFNQGIMTLANIVSAQVAYRLDKRFWDLEFGSHWWDYTRNKQSSGGGK